MKYAGIEELVGQTIVSISGSVGDESLVLTLSNGRVLEMLHIQDCCESVYLEDVAGDLSDLTGSPILLAEGSTNSDVIDGMPAHSDSWTWTFYKLATSKGYVTLRWLGESNGYYSEGVDLVERAAARESELAG